MSEYPTTRRWTAQVWLRGLIVFLGGSVICGVLVCALAGYLGALGVMVGKNDVVDDVFEAGLPSAAALCALISLLVMRRRARYLAGRRSR
jgi:hypothetical protein